MLAQHRQHVEDAGRGGASGQRRPQRLGDGAELESLRSANARTAASVVGGPGCHRRPAASELADQGARLPASAARAPCHRSRAAGRRKKIRAVDQLEQGLGALLQARHGRAAACFGFGVNLAASAAPLARCGSRLLDSGHEVGIGGCGGYSGR